MYRNHEIAKRILNIFSVLKNYRIHRCQESHQFKLEPFVDYTEGTTEHKSIKAALKDLTSTLTHIPIRIGDLYLGSSNVQYQVMPHNSRWPVAQLSLGNKRILYQCRRYGEEVRADWKAVSLQDRIDICNKCADIVASEIRHTLNASIMLGQSKTFRQADEDTCRTINNLRKYALLLPTIENLCTCDESYNGYVMRASDGYIAAMTPHNWTSRAIHLVLCPAMMGKCVIWMPSQYNVLSSYQLFMAFQQAGIPHGVISFVPMNRSYFMYKQREMPYIAGITYAGRVRGYETIAAAVSQHMDPANSFVNMIGPVENRNFHFVHESANVDLVARETLNAAFDYNGQRGNSLENLYVPQSLWVDLRAALIEGASNLIVGDIGDSETRISALINSKAFDRVAANLKYAENSPNCKIICGGNRNRSYGNFIEPTIVVCNTPCDRMMDRQTEGPILSVYVYANKEIDDILQYIGSGAIYTLSCSIFAADKEKVCEIAEHLYSAAANIYINRACIGEMTGQGDELPDLNQELIAGKINLLKHW